MKETKEEILMGLVQVMAKLGLQESASIRDLTSKVIKLIAVLKEAEKHHQGAKSEIGIRIREAISKAERAVKCTTTQTKKQARR